MHIHDRGRPNLPTLVTGYITKIYMIYKCSYFSKTTHIIDLKFSGCNVVNMIKLYLKFHSKICIMLQVMHGFVHVKP